MMFASAIHLHPDTELMMPLIWSLEAGMVFSASVTGVNDDGGIGVTFDFPVPTNLTD